MKIVNDRVYLAVRNLMLAEGDVKQRVVVSCKLLEKIHPSELSADVYAKVTILLAETGKNGPLVNGSGRVLRDKFEHTAKNRRKRTYAMHAEEILNIYNLLCNDES